MLPHLLNLPFKKFTHLVVAYKLNFFTLHTVVNSTNEYSLCSIYYRYYKHPCENSRRYAYKEVHKRTQQQQRGGYHQYSNNLHQPETNITSQAFVPVAPHNLGGALKCNELKEDQSIYHLDVEVRKLYVSEIT